MPPRRTRKRSWAYDDRVAPPAPTTHSIAFVNDLVVLANIRNAIVAYGVEYGVLQVPVARRITQYLRQERLFVVGWSHKRSSSQLFRSSYSLDVATGAWVEDNHRSTIKNDTERLHWIRGPVMIAERKDFWSRSFQGPAVGGRW